MSDMGKSQNKENYSAKGSRRESWRVGLKLSPGSILRCYVDPPDGTYRGVSVEHVFVLNKICFYLLPSF